MFFANICLVILSNEANGSDSTKTKEYSFRRQFYNSVFSHDVIKMCQNEKWHVRIVQSVQNYCFSLLIMQICDVLSIVIVLPKLFLGRESTFVLKFCESFELLVIWIHKVHIWMKIIHRLLFPQVITCKPLNNFKRFQWRTASDPELSGCYISLSLFSFYFLFQSTRIECLAKMNPRSTKQNVGNALGEQWNFCLILWGHCRL